MVQLALLTPQPPKHLSRDEMNLAEFPLTVLSTRANSNVKTLEFSDTIKGKNGEVLNRRWIITAADKFGLPTSSDDEVLLGLLKLTVDSEFKDRKVYFTRYELLKILRWSTEGRNYSRLQKALDRLSGVRIKASNGFFDNETKLHSTRNFGIVDAYEINDGRGPGVEPKPSFFTWSEVIFKSFQVGFIKKLDLDFLLGLESAVSKRLYRYLDKHFWYKARVQQNLFTLAHEKIGISRNYAYASQIRQQLDPAVEELVNRGFLLGVDYIGKGSDTEVIFYSANGARKEQVTVESKLIKLPQRSTVQKERVEDPSSGSSSLERLLVDRGIAPNQVARLLKGREEKMLQRIQDIVVYFDQLVAQNSSKISRSPVGFLYRAVESPERFVLPKDLQKPNREAVVKSSQRSRTATAMSTSSELESKYLTERKLILEQLRGEVEPELMQKITKEVESALDKLKSLISPPRFQEAVRHGVEEKLARLFAVPDFDEWKRGPRFSN